MNNNEIEELKDKYALDRLSEEEHASLEVELLQNTSLAEELKIHTDLVKGVKYAGELELRELLDKLHYQQAENTPPKPNRSRILNYVLGGIMLLGVCAYLFTIKKVEKPMDTKTIFAAYYTPYQPSLQDRGTSLEESISMFNKAYLSQNHELSLAIIKPLQHEITNDIKLMAAISANEEDDLILAEKFLNEIIESKDYYFSDHAIWYKALIKLKSGKKQETEELLKPLALDSEADHHEEAKDLISKLKN